MADATQMTDDELNKVIETGIEPDEPSTPEPPAEEPKEEESAETEQPETQEEEVETPAEEEVKDEGEEQAPAPSRREQLRIQDLLRKYGPPKVQQPTPPTQQDALDYQEALNADPDTIKTLEADRQAVGAAQYNAGQNEGLKRAEFLNWNTSLKIDAPNVEKKYPVLDPNSEQFHPGVASAINNWYLQMSGFDPSTSTVANPNIGYGEFAESFMELVQETAGQKNVQTAKNIAKQAATTGLRPDGGTAKRLNLNKQPHDMNLEELYAAIGQKPPKQ
jgi:hypothetical protein